MPLRNHLHQVRNFVVSPHAEVCRRLLEECKKRCRASRTDDMHVKCGTDDKRKCMSVRLRLGRQAMVPHLFAPKEAKSG